MKNNHANKKNNSMNVEFGSEFVDVNAAKWIESVQSKSSTSSERLKKKKKDCH